MADDVSAFAVLDELPANLSPDHTAGASLMTIRAVAGVLAALVATSAVADDDALVPGARMDIINDTLACRSIDALLLQLDSDPPWSGCAILPALTSVMVERVEPPQPVVLPPRAYRGMVMACVRPMTLAKCLWIVVDPL